MTGGEIAAAVAALLGAGGLGGWAGKTLQAKFRAGVEHRKALNAGAAEENRHDERVYDVLIRQTEHLASRLEALQTHVDSLLRENGKLEKDLAILTERQDSLTKRNVYLESENTRLNAQGVENQRTILHLTERVGVLQSMLERHNIRCPGHGEV